MRRRSWLRVIALHDVVGGYAKWGPCNPKPEIYRAQVPLWVDARRGVEVDWGDPGGGWSSDECPDERSSRRIGYQRSPGG